MQGCTMKILAVTGANRLNRLTETSKQCNENTHLLNQCNLINVSRNLPCCCRPRHTNICFCINRISTVSTLIQGYQGKMSIILQICSKGTGLLFPHQIKIFKIAGFRYSMALRSQFSNMTVAQLKQMNYSFLVIFRYLFTKLLLNCFLQSCHSCFRRHLNCHIEQC